MILSAESNKIRTKFASSNIGAIFEWYLTESGNE